MSLFIEKARQEGNNNPAYYIFGVLASFIGGQILGAIPLLVIMFKKQVYDMEILTNPSLLGISNNHFLALVLLPFLVSFIILWLFIRFIHKKRFLVSLTAFPTFSWQKFWFSFAVWFGFMIATEIIAYLINPENYQFHYAGKEFWILLFICFTLLPIQTSFEELLFRSYLMQSIGMMQAIRLIPLVITSVSFGLMHLMNPEIGEYGSIVMVQYIGIGFLLGLLTLMSDSMELALGLHAANNIYSASLVSFRGSALTTDTLFYTKEMDVSAGSMLLSIVLMSLFYYIMHKKYKFPPLSQLWTSYK